MEFNSANGDCCEQLNISISPMREPFAPSTTETPRDRYSVLRKEAKLL
jgi:hypothetical protein